MVFLHKIVSFTSKTQLAAQTQVAAQTIHVASGNQTSKSNTK
jgi:hypothetical protein